MTSKRMVFRGVVVSILSILKKIDKRGWNRV
jgi:hypothetical protein